MKAGVDAGGGERASSRESGRAVQGRSQLRGTSQVQTAASWLPSPSPPLQLCWKKPRAPRSAAGAGGGTETAHALSAPGCRFPGWPVRIVPGCGPVAFISFLPPRDNNGHCLCAQSALDTFPTLCHFVPRPAGEAGRLPAVSSQRPGRCRCGGGTPAPARTGGRASSGAGVFLPSSWTPGWLSAPAPGWAPWRCMPLAPPPPPPPGGPLSRPSRPAL